MRAEHCLTGLEAGPLSCRVVETGELGLVDGVELIARRRCDIELAMGVANPLWV